MYKGISLKTDLCRVAYASCKFPWAAMKAAVSSNIDTLCRVDKIINTLCGVENSSAQ